MVRNSSVIFKGRRDGITILLDGEIPFEELQEALHAKMQDAQQFFGTATASITFKGRELTEAEEASLLDVMTQSSNMSISFTKSESGQTFISPRPAPPEEEPMRPNVSLLSATDNMTHFQKGSLRSGQKIQYAGSVVLMGDVNPGAEIVAEGNVIVLGAIKGMVHVGSSGNRDCYASAFDMRPTQLRIADLITYVPKEMVTRRSNEKPTPVYAYIQDGQIYIESLVV